MNDHVVTWFQFGLVGTWSFKVPLSYNVPRLERPTVMSWPKLISFYYCLIYIASWMHFCVGTLWNNSATQRPETVVCAVAQLCLDFASSRLAESMDYRVSQSYKGNVDEKMLVGFSQSNVIGWQHGWEPINPRKLRCILHERNDQTFSTGHSKK